MRKQKVCVLFISQSPVRLTCRIFPCYLLPVTTNLVAGMGFIQCSGCGKSFGNRGYSQHISKSPNPHCQLAEPCVQLTSPSAHIETLPLQVLFTDNTGDVDIAMEDPISLTAPALSDEFTATRGGTVFPVHI